MGNSVPMAVDSESQLVKLRILPGILGVRDFTAGRRQGEKKKIKRKREPSVLCLLTIFFFLQMKRPSIAPVGGSDPGWSLWGAGRVRKAAPWPEHHISVDLNPQGPGVS